MSGIYRDPRGWGLGAVTAVYISLGMAYTITDYSDPLPIGLDVIAEIVPIWVYGILWFAAAIDGLWLLLGHRTALGVAFMTGMPSLWCMAYFITWAASGFTSRDWITVVRYLSLAVIVVCFGVIQPKVVTGRHGPQ